MRNTSVSLAVLIVAACSSRAADSPAPATVACHPEEAPLPAPSRFVARWAFSPWISKDISTGPDTYAFVGGFQDRDIPVGAVVLDSPWETHYNTFVPNPTRYPEFPKMVSDMHARGVKVVLWTTQMVNTTGLDVEPGGDRYDGPASNFDEGQRCGYFVDDADTSFWWKGSGAAVDFFNARARTWWHAQQDRVLDLGIDGWKLDFGESYIKNDPMKTAAGEKALKEYSEKYYDDFLAYGRKKRGEDFITMVRAWDESYAFQGRFFARKEDAPIAWMGDNRRDWVGLADALEEMSISAKAGYVVLGSDIGGYLDRDDKNLLGPEIPFDPVNFAKWVALGAMTPFMQLHGRGNFTPWTVPARADEIVVVYKYWAKLHEALVPFLFSATDAAVNGGTPMMNFQGGKGDFRYVLGGAFLVAPILDGTGKRDVAFPVGARWYDFATHKAYDGGATAQAYDASELGRIPLFVKEGALVPMNVKDGANGLGDATSAAALTVLAYPARTASRFVLLDEDGTTVELTARADDTSITVKIAGSKRPLRLRVRLDAAPSKATVNGADAQAPFDAASSSAWISAPAAASNEVILAR